MLAYARSYLLEFIPAKTVIPQSGGTVTLVLNDDTVLSVQPNGNFETRPSGTAGPYEKAVQTPQGLVYAPLGANGQAYLVPIVTEIPNV
jgi:hypothetical protein